MSRPTHAACRASARTHGMGSACVTTGASSLLCTITQQAVRLCRLSPIL